MERYNLSYRYSLDYGTNWIELSEIVDSSQTSITHNLCSAGFKSQKDSASFTIPAVQSPIKQNLINALIDNSTILVEISENGGPIFTGYVDKDNISIRSYPLTSTITLELTDVSTKTLDDKVKEHIYLKQNTVTQIVHFLLDKAGYTYDSSIILPSDEITLEAFVIDKDDSKTYREYIDTLLFETGGYVLDFNEKGIARIVKIDYNASGSPSVVDNPMTSEGMSTKTSILKEDGVSLQWASTKWSKDNNQLLWQDSISRSISDDNYVVGEDVANGAYWPTDGELTPTYQEYNSDLLDSDYLTNKTRKQNEDLAIIVAEDVRAEIQATKNNKAFNDWQYPLIQEFIDDYDLTTNPIAYSKKAWYLLRNNSGATVNIQHFRLYGKVFYKDKLHTLKTKDTKNPKEYEAEYIYNETHANQFLQFYWHFLKTSRFSVSWKEVNENRTLGDLVLVYHKGSLSYVKAIIAGKTTTFIGKTKIVSYSAVGVAAQVVPYPTLSSISTKGGNENRSILDVVEQYATSIEQQGAKTAWQSTMPTLSAINKYLWQKETIYYTDGSFSESEKIIGVYGDTGKDGATGSSAQVEYAYSKSLSELTSGDISWGNSDIYWGERDVTWITWSSTPPAEKEGYYIWMRVRVGDGPWSYTRLTGARAQVCTISCDKSYVARNDRLTTSAVYLFSASVQGYYDKTVRVFINNEDKTSELAQTGTLYTLGITVPYKNAFSLTATIYLDDKLMDTVTLSVINETDYYQFQGSMTADEASTLTAKVKGDTYVDTDTHTIMYYTGSDWQTFSLSLLDTDNAKMAGQILSSAEEAYWKLWSSMTDEEKNELYNLYGYKAEVISRFIAAEKLQMYGDGVIASSAISTNPTETLDERGFLTEQGYRFEGANGILRANNAYMSAVYIDALSKIYGEIESDSLTTHNGKLETKIYKSNTAENTKYWSYNDLYNAMNANAMTSASGSYAGYSVSQYAKVTDSRYMYNTMGIAVVVDPPSSGYGKGEALYKNHFGAYGNPNTTTYKGTTDTGGASASYTNTSPISQTITIRWAIYYSDVQIKLNGSIVSQSSKEKSTTYNEFTQAIPTGSTLSVSFVPYASSSWGSTYYGYGMVTVDLPQSAMRSAGITSLGLWLYYASAWRKLSETAYQSTSLNLLGVTNSYITWEDNCYEVIDGVMQSEPTASGGYATLDPSSHITASDGTSFVPELVSWNSKAISFSNGNGKFLMINKQKWFKSFSFDVKVVASSSYTKTANLTPKEETTTIGNENEPFSAVYAKAVFVQNASGEWVKIEV